MILRLKSEIYHVICIRIGCNVGYEPRRVEFIGEYFFREILPLKVTMLSSILINWLGVKVSKNTLFRLDRSRRELYYNLLNAKIFQMCDGP